MDTRWPFKLFVEASQESEQNCSITFHFGESGHYKFETKIVVVNRVTDLSCAMVVNTKPVNSNIRKYVSNASKRNNIITIIVIEY
jgi:hypothetical protein